MPGPQGAVFACPTGTPMMWPMRRSQALQIIAQHERELRELGVRSLSFFGSVARDQAGPGSDADVLVEFDRPVGYFHLFDVQERLEAFLGCKVDLVTPGGLRPELRQGILTEAVRAA
jgi:predicted nucleotidyltransferase